MRAALVIGSGVYVRGSSELKSPVGALGAGLVEAARQGLFDCIFVSSRSIEKSNFAAQKLNMEIGQDIVECVPFSDIDLEFVAAREVMAAYVAVPDEQHVSILDMCLELGVHTFCVKPFVTNYSDAVRLANEFKGKKLIGAVDFHKRFDPANLILKERLAKAGTVSRVFVDYSQDAKVPLYDFSDWFASTNVFQYLGVHYVDLIHWLTGATPVDVSVFTQRGALSNVITSDLDVLDCVDVVVSWTGANGEPFNSFHLTSWSERHGTYCPSRQKIEVLTESGRLQSEQADRGFSIVDDKGLRLINPNFCQRIRQSGVTHYFGYGVDSVVEFTKLALNHVVSFPDSICMFEDALASVKVTEMVNKKLAGLG